MPYVSYPLLRRTLFILRHNHMTESNHSTYKQTKEYVGSSHTMLVLISTPLHFWLGLLIVFTRYKGPSSTHPMFDRLVVFCLLRWCCESCSFVKAQFLFLSSVNLSNSVIIRTLKDCSYVRKFLPQQDPTTSTVWATANA